MGKKKKLDQRDFNRGLMNFAGDAGGSKEAKELLERYDVEGYRHGRTDRGSAGFRGTDDIKKDLADAMMKDPHTVMTMQNAAMAGNKDAKKFAKKGFKPGAKHLTGAWETLKDLKKEYVGGGGMNGPENIAGLTYATAKADREAQTAAYDKQYASQDMLNSKMDELKEKFKTMEESEKAAPEIVESDELKAARARLAGNEPSSSSDSLYKTGTPRPEPTTAFRKENEGAPATDDRKKAVGSYLEQYKKDVIAGGRIGEATTNNLNNAYNTVIRSDI